MEKILLVDGNSLVFRAYFATMSQRMSTKQGQPTNAVYGFANMMTKALEIIDPNYCLVAWDTGDKTFRHDLFSEYKGTRKQVDESLISQFPLVRSYLDHFVIKRLEISGYEADDIIGSLSQKFKEKIVVILTSDRDMLQLINEHVSVLLMKKGISEMEEVTLDILKSNYGLEPYQVVELKSLMGDSADNIPGIKGIGEKTALKLLNDYQTLDGVYQHVDELKGKLKEKIVEGQETAYLSKTLATIITNVDIDLELEECVIEKDEMLLAKFFRQYDMNSLLKRLESQNENDEQTFDFEEFDKSFVKDDVIICPLVLEGIGYNAKVDGFIIANDKHVSYIDIEDAKTNYNFKELITGNYTKKAIYSKELFHVLKRMDLSPASFIDDLLICAYLVDSNITSIDKLLDSYQLWPESNDRKDILLNLCQQSTKLFDSLHDFLEANDLEELYEEMEIPLIEILVDMEIVGIKIEKDELITLSDGIQAIVDDLTQKIYGYAGKEFNINSPKQLSIVLFDELELPSKRKKSTAVDVLEGLRDKHPIIDLILDYRKYQKFYSTYTQGLQKYITDEGRIHTSFSQTTAQTGRLSSLEPNLQNISVRDEETKQIRKVFVADPGHHFLSVDYSQIELRVLAHMANEEHMIDAFNNNIDIHTMTAQMIYECGPEDEITSLMRRNAKAVNFGIIYGISDFGLSEQLSITPSQAHDYIENYLEAFDGISEYMTSIVDYCKEHGYVKTIFNRRRYIPEINDKNFVVKQRAERAAMNAPIQGSAADLIKLAMVKISDQLKKKQLNTKLVLQVHDELVLLVCDNELEEVKKMVIDTMKNIVKLKVPLEVSSGVGINWYEV